MTDVTGNYYKDKDLLKPTGPLNKAIFRTVVSMRNDIDLEVPLIKSESVKEMNRVHSKSFSHPERQRVTNRYSTRIDLKALEL